MDDKKQKRSAGTAAPPQPAAGRSFRSLTADDFAALFAAAAKEAVGEHHAAGRPTCHADERGIYLLYPDGRKEYTGLVGGR